MSKQQNLWQQDKRDNKIKPDGGAEQDRRDI
jgi:hypothetical protein